MKTHIANTMAIQKRHPKALQHRQHRRVSQPPKEDAWGGAWACSIGFFEALSVGKGLPLITHSSRLIEMNGCVKNGTF
jgi:hypothetical protein